MMELKKNQEFLEACSSGDNDRVKKFLREGVNVEITGSKDGRSGLYLACENGHIQTAAILLAHGAEITGLIRNTEPKSHTRLALAAAEQLLEGQKLADTQKPVEEKNAALHRACREGTDIDIVAAIHSGADVNDVDPATKLTPLQTVCAAGKTDSVLPLILNGANREAITRDGVTALGLACLNGHKQIAKLMVELGANPVNALPALAKTATRGKKTTAFMNLGEMAARGTLNAAVRECKAELAEKKSNFGHLEAKRPAKWKVDADAANAATSGGSSGRAGWQTSALPKQAEDAASPEISTTPLVRPTGKS